MQYRAFNRILSGLLLAVLALTLSACGGNARPDGVAAPNIPSAFDVTLLAEKDGQFDMDGSTLSEEDVKGNFRYRRDNGNPVKSVILRRGEKQKVTGRHITGLARLGMELKVHTYLQEKRDGEITEVRTESSSK